MAWFFICSEDTHEESFERKLFGNDTRKDVQKGDTLFLYDLINGKTYGPFTAETDINKNIVQGAWNGKYPWQVRVSWNDLYKIDADELPYVDFDEEVPQSEAEKIERNLRERGRKWNPEEAIPDSVQEMKQEIRELEADIHRLAHRIEEARMPGSGHPADREVKIDRLKGEFYAKMKNFVWAVRRYDRETNEFGFSTNQ